MQFNVARDSFLIYYDACGKQNMDGKVILFNLGFQHRILFEQNEIF